MINFEIDSLIQFNLELGEQAALKAKASTIQIFEENAYNSPQPLGSGILFTMDI